MMVAPVIAVMTRINKARRLIEFIIRVIQRICLGLIAKYFVFVYLVSFLKKGPFLRASWLLL